MFQIEVDHHIGRGARCGHTDFLAFQIGWRLIVSHRLVGHSQNNGGCTPLLHKGAVHLPFGLQVDGVLKRTRYHIGATAHDGLQGFGAAGKVRHFDFETFVIKVAIDLGNGQGQIVDQRLAAHGNGQVFFLDFLRTAQRWQ